MPDMQQLREAGVNAALAPIRARLTALKQGVTESVELEDLSMKIAAIAGARLAVVTAEVDRRAEVFAETQVSSPHVLGNPKKRAMQSVLDDLITGRFG